MVCHFWIPFLTIISSSSRFPCLLQWLWNTWLQWRIKQWFLGVWTTRLLLWFLFLQCTHCWIICCLCTCHDWCLRMLWRSCLMWGLGNRWVHSSWSLVGNKSDASWCSSVPVQGSNWVWPVHLLCMLYLVRWSLRGTWLILLLRGMGVFHVHSLFVVFGWHFFDNCRPSSIGVETGLHFSMPNRFPFDSNPIQNKSPARQTLYLIVLVMQSFEATCWLPKTKKHKQY